MGDAIVADDQDASLASAWAKVKSFFSETPAKGACIPCATPKPIVGPAWEKAAQDVFPGQQHFGNCGLQSSRQLVEQAKGAKLGKTEEQFMNDAIASCGAGQGSTPETTGGTSAATRQCVMQQYGVASTVKPATLANVDDALRNGKGVIISSDADTIWGTQGQAQGMGGGGRHAVILTNAIYDSSGKMTGVDVNDTGLGTRYAMSTEDLQKCLTSGSGQMNVTDVRIWPPH